MFLGRGNLILSTRSQDRALRAILSELLAGSFTGYIFYRNERASISAALIVISGEVRACRSIGGVEVYEGSKCCDVLAGYLDAPEGLVEVFISDEGVTILDLLMFPASIVDSPARVLDKFGIGLRPQATPERPQPAGGQSLPIAQPTWPGSIELSLSGITPVDECLDPIVLYNIIKRSTLLDYSLKELTLVDVLRKLIEVKESKRAEYVYISGNIKNLTFRAVYSTSSNTVYIEVGDSGTLKCGRSAITEIGDSVISRARVWAVL